MWLNLIFSATAAVFLAMTMVTLWHLRWVRRLPKLEDHFPSAAEPIIRCSIVIAARDEEARIEQTIRHLLAQHGVELEIIVVDDRSTDRTGEILQRLAQGGYTNTSEARGRAARWLAGQMSCLPRRRRRGDGGLDSFHGCGLLAEAQI